MKPTLTEPISLKLFKAKACIDWLELLIATTRPTQFRHIKDALDQATGCTLYAVPLDAGAGGVATQFKVRFYDHLANDHQALRTALDKVAETYPVAHAPTVLALELACDFWHKGSPARLEADTLAMTHRLQTSLHADATKPRQFIPGETSGSQGSNRFLNMPGMRMDPRFNFRIGNKHDDLSWQVYFKRVDKRVPIKRQDQWRARVEVTMQGLALRTFGIASLGDLTGFSFERMACLFRFRRPSDPTKQARGNLFIREAILANRRINDATPERGMHSFLMLGRRDRFRKVRAESTHLEPDKELQERVRGALKRLSV